MKYLYKTVSTMTEAGLREAEALHEAGWRSLRVTPFSTLFEKFEKKAAGASAAEPAGLYQVLVEYRDPRAGTWRGPQEAAEPACQRYGVEAARMSAGGIRGVYLTRCGVVVAFTREEEL